MSVFLEHFAENEDGRKYHRPVTSHTAQPLSALCGKPYEPCSGPCIKTDPADWLVGKETRELLFLGGKGLLLPMACSPHAVAGPAGNTFHRQRSSIRAFKSGDNIIFNVGSIMEKAARTGAASQRHLLALPGRRPRALMRNPTPDRNLQSPLRQPGAGLGNCTKEVIQDITGQEEEGNQYHHPHMGALSLLGSQTASPRPPSPRARQETSPFLNPHAPWPPRGQSPSIRVYQFSIGPRLVHLFAHST